MGPPGLEPDHLTTYSDKDLRKSADPSAAKSDAKGHQDDVDTDLAALVESWPTLSDEQRRRILAVVNGATA